MVQKIGVLVRDLSLGQFSYQLIRSANKLAGSISNIDPIVFYERLTPPATGLNFARMQMAEGWGFDGIALATNITTASKLIEFPGPKKKLFFVPDLEWIRMRNFQFRDLQPIYAALPLIARSEEHARILSECWGGKVISIMPQLDLFEVLKCSTLIPT